MVELKEAWQFARHLLPSTPLSGIGTVVGQTRWSIAVLSPRQAVIGLHAPMIRRR